MSYYSRKSPSVFRPFAGTGAAVRTMPWRDGDTLLFISLCMQEIPPTLPELPELLTVHQVPLGLSQSTQPICNLKQSGKLQRSPRRKRPRS